MPDNLSSNPGRGILGRLKAETLSRHTAIEQALDLIGDALTLQLYRARLEKFYGFYHPSEEALQAIGGWEERGLNFLARRKVPFLEADLRALGAVPERLPLCRNLPPLGTPAEAFGCLYVVEGATLGGKYIYRHVRQLLALTPNSGARFFYGYGNQSGTMWRAFGAALVAFATTGALQDGVVQSAAETFDRLHGWFFQGALDHG